MPAASVKQVRHPYLLALDRYDIVDGRLMIVMELADCNLWDRFRECRDKGLVGIPRDELMLYMSETAEVLDLMNDQFQLQHLDIKPQNLFLLYNHVKVADFGQVKDLQGVMASVTGGITPVYAAPETFDGIITRFCDQYSLACVYQELLTGQRPFDGSSMSQLLMQHLKLPPNLDPSRRATTGPAALQPGAGEEAGRPVAECLRVRPRSLSERAARSLDANRYAVSDTGKRRSRGSTIRSVRIRRGQVAGGGRSTPATRRSPSSRRSTRPPPLYTPAPPELSGDGGPACAAGRSSSALGQTGGLRPAPATPLRPHRGGFWPTVAHTPAGVRSLYIDTDPDTLDERKSAPAPQDRPRRADSVGRGRSRRS